MEQIVVTRPDGTKVGLVTNGVTEIRSAKQTYKVNGEDYVDVTIESSIPQTYMVGDSIEVYGRKYRLFRPADARKEGVRKFVYTMAYEGASYELCRVCYDLSIETTNNTLQDVQDDCLTGDLRRFAEALIANVNRVYPNTWELGECPDTEGDKTLVFGENDNCQTALATLCREFEYEFDIQQKEGKYILHFKKEVSRETPFFFEYGQANGLYYLDRKNVDGNNIVSRLRALGSTSNITHKYRANRLCLPGKTKGQSYIEKADTVAKYGIFEASKYFDDIKPTFTGKVEAVTDSIYMFRDSTMFDLNALEPDGVTTKYLIAGSPAKVHFNTGNLAGYEFNVQAYDHATHTFTLAKLTDDRGEEFPSEKSQAFRFAAGDEYKILDVTMPEQYVEAAEQRLLEAANAYYDRNCQPRVQYGLKLRPEYLAYYVKQRNYPGTPNVFGIGDYIRVIDKDIEVDKSIRIQAFTRDMLNDYEYDITLSDVSSRSLGQQLKTEVKKLNKLAMVNDLKNPSRVFSKRRWWDVMDTVTALEAAMLSNFSEAINPIVVRTMSLLAGDESLQYRFIDSKDSLNTVVHHVRFDGTDKKLYAQAGLMQHMTMDIQTISSSHDVSEYRFWELDEFVSDELDDNALYYLYIKADKDIEEATFMLSGTAIAMNDEEGYYHLLVGILNKAHEGERSFVTLYGFTEVLPGRITTDRIVSSDGQNFLDLVQNAFRIGNNNTSLSYNTAGDGQLVLKGTMVQSPAGTVDYLEVDRGAWATGTVYYAGDKVSWNGDVYKCLKTTSAGITPASTDFWKKVVSKGADGKDGNISFTSFVFTHSKDTPATPPDTSGRTPEAVIPAGWQDAPAVEIVNPGEYIGNWSLQEDGTRRSPAIDHDEMTKSRVVFTTPQDNMTISVYLKVSSERGFDYAILGMLDNDAVSLDANFTERISGFTSVTVPVTVPNAGTHFIEIAYAKDSSSSQNTDCAWYSITFPDEMLPPVVTDEPWWMSKAIVALENNLYQAKSWSLPVRVTGEDGLPGADGKYWDYRYKVESEFTGMPTVPVGLNPSGWSTKPPTRPEGSVLWMSMCEKNASGTEILQSWSAPVKISGEKGDKGATGAQGVPGLKGADGTTYYTHIKFSDYANGKNGNTSAMYDTPTDSTVYIGIAVNQLSPVESSDPAVYTWSKFRGDDGVPGTKGADGVTLYTWIKYADDINGNGMSDSGVGKEFIGFAYNKTTATESTNKADYKWSEYTGADGIDGIDGIDGKDGKDGDSVEFIYKLTADLIKPSTPGTSQTDDYVPSGWTDDPSGVSETYLCEWVSERKKKDGVWGAFSTPALWAKFGAKDGTDTEWIYKQTTTSTKPSTPGTSQTDDYVPTGWTDDPSGVSETYLYEWTCKRDRKNGVWSTFSTPALWAKFGEKGATGAQGAKGDKGATGSQGVQGLKGADGTTYYTHIKFSDYANGKNGNTAAMYDTPTDSTVYIGIAVNQLSPVENTDPAVYTWSKFRGDDGVPGTKGADGVTLYTWIKYADDINGNGMSDSGVGKEFIGFAYNKTTATESTNKADYKWNEYKGEKGDKGDTGAKGDKGATGSQGAQGPAGAAGKEGTSYLYAYYANNSIGTAPTKPGTGGTISGGWSASPNKGSYRYVWVSQCVKTNGVWSAWSAPTPYIVPGEDGAAGKAGPAMVFRGRAVWNQNEGTSMTFYNNASRRDVVVSDWGGGSIVYYIYKGTDGKTLTSHTVNNVNTSWDAAEWESFGASFSSIATGLLLAENANIAHWIFQDQKLVSEDGGAFLDGRTGEVSIKGKFRSSSGGFTSEISDGDLKVYSGDTETTAGRRILLEANSSSGYKWGALEISDTSGYSALLRGNCLVLKKGNVEKLNINTNIYEDADMMQIILNRATIVVQNNLNIQGLPTNSQGLKNGDVYKSEGYLRIYSN